MHGSVTVHIDAPPEKVFALVSDVTRIGEYSPETFDAEWLDGAVGPATGARFRGHVKRNGRGPTYWTTCEVVAFDPPREFAFTVMTGGRGVNTWRYTLEARDGGTDATESFSLADALPLRIYWLLLGWARGRTNERNMRTTLERIKAQVEPTS
jgi:uncharacterized protein YndB with AHSA1/START domain